MSDKYGLEGPTDSPEDKNQVPNPALEATWENTAVEGPIALYGSASLEGVAYGLGDEPNPGAPNAPVDETPVPVDPEVTW